MHFLIKVAKDIIENKVKLDGYVFHQIPEADKEICKKTGGVFVTIKKNGTLRGCVGQIISHRSIIDNVRDMAIQAAFNDSRFNPITEKELPYLEYEITILHPPILIKDKAEIEIGKHGLIIEADTHRGLLLPQVATDHNWNVDTFLSHTCIKAGLPADAWARQAGLKVYIFEGEVINGKV